MTGSSNSTDRNKVLAFLLQDVRVPTVVGLLMFAAFVIASVRLLVNNPLIFILVLVVSTLFFRFVVDRLRKNVGMKTGHEVANENFDAANGKLLPAALNAMCHFQLWQLAALLPLSAWLLIDFVVSIIGS
jgi:hypothetical protein